MLPTLVRRALPFGICVALTGCATSSPATTDSSVPVVETSSSSALPSSAPSTSAATGSTRSSDKSFAVVLPSGWKTAKAALSGVVLTAKAGSATDRVISNITVAAASPTRGPALSDVAQQGELAMRADGATISPLADRTIGGEPATGYVVARSKDGVSIAQIQYFVIHADKVFTITASGAKAQQSALEGTLAAFLGTWSWSS